MQRHDVEASGHAPQETQDIVLAMGGKNPYGEPLWRVILAQKRICKQAGEWCDWDENLELNERGGMVWEGDDRRASGNKPIRVRVEMREVQKYPAIEGWILERWYPARTYGTPAEWALHALPDGTPMLGPYPERGDYEMVLGPCRQVPTSSELRIALSAYDHNLNSRKGTAASRHREYLERLQHEKLTKERKKAAEAEYMLRNHIGNLLTSTSLAAGRYREQLARKAGIREHVGN